MCPGFLLALAYPVLLVATQAEEEKQRRESDMKGRDKCRMMHPFSEFWAAAEAVLQVDIAFLLFCSLRQGIMWFMLASNSLSSQRDLELLIPLPPTDYKSAPSYPEIHC